MRRAARGGAPPRRRAAAQPGAVSFGELRGVLGARSARGSSPTFGRAEPLLGSGPLSPDAVARFEEVERDWRLRVAGEGSRAHRARIAVVGAGIIGLTIADLALGLGYGVDVYHDRPLFATTSALAAGLVEPVAPPESPAGERLVLEAFADSFPAWAALALRAPEDVAGIRRVTGYRRVAGERPAWAAIVDGYRLLPAAELPVRLPGMTWAEQFLTVVVDPRLHLSRVAERLARGGARFALRHIASPTELVGTCDAIINATGIGAATFVRDSELFRSDGHVITVPRPGDLCDVVFDWDPPVAADGDLELHYAIPRRDDVVVGGTLRVAPASRGEPALDPEMPARLLAAIEALLPGIAGPVLNYAAGSRPMRSMPRLGVEAVGGGTPMVHCYGTGGSGWTLAPGLARMAVEQLCVHVPPPRARERG